MTALQTVKKLQLWSLIKKVGLYCDEDEQSLQEYGKEVYNASDIDKAIICFTDLLQQTKDGFLKGK